MTTRTPNEITGYQQIDGKGKIPGVFLRGCGVPDEFIAYIGSMVGRPIEYYSYFTSYSTRDQEFAERLHADLQAKGVRPPQRARNRCGLEGRRG